ncbi:uncharacterized protein EI97DRAFT_501535 [Westerdykella ornata]|uniref:F-box domain-containing protein n=1 Tax=Westerdykella ornata TaxID=318751 RepID=A0A6A6JJ62_WESOR|nr:uncharacterized protein EI97DRAFT_501535 [Westerdykella ornata]KAF2276285.1 hypothetical protein EI97DRAFT_501535 [Westerdykella ornata]
MQHSYSLPLAISQLRLEDHADNTHLHTMSTTVPPAAGAGAQYTPSTPEQKNLLNLPNEILAEIVSRLSRKDLLNLKCVCRTLRSFAQDALLSPVMVSSNKTMVNLLKEFAFSPSLGNRVFKVNLAGYFAHRTFTRGYLQRFRISDDPLLDSLPFNYGELLGSTLNSRDLDEFLLLKHSVLDWWGECRSFLLGLLIMVCPNLHELSLHLSLLSKARSGVPMLTSGLPLFPRPLMRLLGDRITTLTLLYDLGLGLEPPSTDMHGFVNLKRLRTIPDVLFGGSLPKSLKHIQLLSCNQRLLHFLVQEKIKDLPALRKLDFFFEYSLTCALCLATTGMSKQIANLSDFVVDVVQRGVSIKAVTEYEHHGKSFSYTYDSRQLLAELSILELLTPGEIYFAASMKVTPSEVVARDKRGPRRRSPFEIRMLRQCRGMPLALFTSPTFNQQAWIGVRFFTASKTRWGEEKKEVRSEGKKRKKGFPSSRPVPPQGLTVPIVSTELFDAVAWRNVTFFTA